MRIIYLGIYYHYIYLNHLKTQVQNKHQEIQFHSNFLLNFFVNKILLYYFLFLLSSGLIYLNLDFLLAKHYKFLMFFY